MLKQFIRVGAVLLSLIVAGGASAEPWQIVQSSGPVWFGQDSAKLVSLGANTDVPGGDMLVTGDGGRAMLVRGQQTMVVGPNSVVTVPDAASGGMTTILQRYGEVTFDVDHQNVQHFTVETPYLAAVVKGTKFVVNVDGGGGAVSVERGLVQVDDLATGEQVDTAPGQRATVDGVGAKLAISGSGSLALIAPGNARAPMVTPMSTQELHSVQSKANNNGSIQALNEVRGNDAGGLLAIGAADGGSGDGPNGTGGTGTVDLASNGAGGTATNVGDFPLTLARRNPHNDGISPFTFMMVAGFMTVLAIGLAYVRRGS